MTKHFDIGEAKARLSELVAAAVRGEEVILDRAGQPQVRLVPVEIKSAADAERIVASRRAALGMYEHLVTAPIPSVRELKPTDEELLERERQKFGDLF